MGVGGDAQDPQVLEALLITSIPHFGVPQPAAKITSVQILFIELQFIPQHLDVLRCYPTTTADYLCS